MCLYDYDRETGYGEFSECQDFIQADQKLHDVKHAIKNVIDILYSQGNLDTARLDDYVGQICDAVGVKCPALLPVVQRQHSEPFEYAKTINL